MDTSAIKELFTEKFRPKNLGQLIAPPRIKNELSKGLIQNMLLYGSAGTGKTSTGFILSKPHTTLYINASSERGIDVIREKIGRFCSTISLEGGKEKLFQKKYAFPIFLAVSIAAFNQLTGINALLYYLNSIFQKAGFDEVSSDLQAVVIGATNLVFTVLAMLVIDKVGRKILLLVGAVGVTLCLGGVSWVFFTNSHQELLLYFLIGFIAFFAFSQGAVIWVYISEVFPNAVRAKGQALGCFTHWALCAAVSWTFPVLAASSGGYPFLIFALVTALQFFVVLKFYPETKGVSLEELEKRLVRDS